MKWLWFTVPAVLLLTQAFGDEIKSLRHRGHERSYSIHLPKKEKACASPLVIVLQSEEGEYEGWESLADKESFITVFPKPFNAKWNDCNGAVDDLGFLKQVIQEVASVHKVDTKRVYMTGISNGAALAFRAGVELSDYLAAVAPVKGSLQFYHRTFNKPSSLFYVAGDCDPFPSLFTWLNMLEISPFKIIELRASGLQMTIYGPDAEGKEAVLVQGAGLNVTEQIWSFFRTRKL